ncbi:hypothetical protein MIZ03_3608 [Rhodoferax lithotrophicus]|uniref:CAAX prenyl protease 2/Lysostaphin resistance protein A-like domain-containing protein n=1 Tax=Rhodoferax lithotrophicus TaxID=2798804 RepID=A0ABN6DAE0_9BURK|nr:JDVT-CTERM system glutamic-type intramembrane protease [Rhodoferax sp. MIZ03]BCO28698.1 hypothetical protein MIZ03_3608 [Rhodoferax sp. MIZ03]
MQVLRDRQLGVALGAAPFFWLLWLWFHAPAPDLLWPFVEPVRFLMPALIYPVLEEMTFRGLLQPALLQRPWGSVCHWRLSTANLVCTVLFAISHLVWHSGLQALAVIVPSLIFGYFRDRYGRIAPSVVLHVFYNSGFIWLFAGR